MARDNVKDLLLNQKGSNDKRDKTINIILSIIVAVFLWGYVIGLVNPETEKSFSNITVSTVGKLDLEERGLAVVDMGETTVDVNITGRRSDIFDITSGQIVAKIDLSECELGENQVPVRVTVLSGMTDVESKPEYISVTVNRIVAETRDVKVSVDGDIPDGYELGAISLDQDEIQISGGSSLVSMVDHLDARLTVTQETQTYSAKLALTPVDEEGNPVEGITLQQDWVSVEAKLLKTKTVDLKVNVTGEEKENLVVTTDAPDTIKIKGEESVIAALSSVETAAVDLSAVTESGKQTLTLLLPEGTELSDSQKAPQITFKVETVTQKSFEADASSVLVEGLAEGAKATVKDQTVTVTCYASASQLQKITKENTELYVDVSGAENGEGTFPIQVRNDNPMKSAVVSPATITVTIDSEGE